MFWTQTLLKRSYFGAIKWCFPPTTTQEPTVGFKWSFHLFICLFVCMFVCLFYSKTEHGKRNNDSLEPRLRDNEVPAQRGNLRGRWSAAPPTRRLSVQ